MTADTSPTDEHRQIARRIATEPPWTEPSREYWSDKIAQALATQEAKIHARYALIADGFVEDNPRRQWIADAIKVLGRGPQP